VSVGTRGKGQAGAKAVKEGEGKSESLSLRRTGGRVRRRRRELINVVLGGEGEFWGRTLGPRGNTVLGDQREKKRMRVKR